MNLVCWCVLVAKVKQNGFELDLKRSINRFTFAHSIIYKTLKLIRFFLLDVENEEQFERD